MQNLSVDEALEELPTLCQAFIKFAESLEFIPLDELTQVVKDRSAQDILLAANNFKTAMRATLVNRVGLH